MSGIKQGKTILWALTFFFAWLLSFPLHGPVLFSAAMERNLLPDYMGLVFTFSHAAGLFFSGVLLRDDKKWKQIMSSSAILTLLLSLAIIPAQSSLWPLLIILMGFSSALFVIGWSVPFSQIVVTSRLTFMAAVIFWANIFYIFFSLLSRFLAGGFLLSLVCLPLIGAVILTHYIETEREGSSTKPQAPYKTYLLFFGLIFCFCINGGIMYNTIMPSFISLDFFSYDTVILPYVGGLLFMWFFGKKLTTIFPMYLSTGLMGLGFLAFALLRTTYLGFFTGGLLILFSLGVLDVFLWTILGQIAENYGNPFKVFGWGLSINVLALSFGGLLVQEWLMPNPEGYLITPLLAAGLIFIVIMLIPAFALRIEEDLLARLPKDPSLKVGELQTFPELSALRFLTRREQEIAVLILNGDSNKEIADKLFISENTVKVHQKSINQKMGISGKQDLLALAVKALNRRSHDLTLS